MPRVEVQHLELECEKLTSSFLGVFCFPNNSLDDTLKKRNLDVIG